MSRIKRAIEPANPTKSHGQLKIEYVPIEMLREWAGNPRVIHEDQYRSLVKSLGEFGVVEPLVVDQGYRVVGGHQRLKALRSIGVKEVPIVRLSLTRKRFAILNIALNRISGDWDKPKLRPLLEELAPLPELDLTGFSPQEANYVIENFSNEYAGDREDYTPTLPGNPKTKPGTLWTMGEHCLFCGDATDTDAWKRTLGNRMASMVFMDPPYGVAYDLHKKFALDRSSGEVRHHKSWGAIENDEDTEVAVNSLPHLFENLTDDGVAYMTCGTKLLVKIANWLDTNGIRYAPFLIWDKGYPVISWERYHAEHEFIIYCGPGSYPTRGCCGIKSRWFGPKNETTIWRIPSQPKGELRVHPTQKPVALYERAMINSTGRGEIIVDPFAGSGTCIIAAEKLARKASCIELDPRYCDVAVSRWEANTHRKAQRQN